MTSRSRSTESTGRRGELDPNASASTSRVGSGAAPSVIEAEPAEAGEIFGGQLEVARRYVQLLAGAGTERGLIGPRETGRLWTRHVLNSAVLGQALPAAIRVVDIGSGAGLPGIPLALARPDLRVDLVETLERRATFLREAVEELGLGERVRVVRSRAEEAVTQVGDADAVTARAVAPLGKLARWSAPLLREGGIFIVLKGNSAPAEIERDGAECSRSGIEDLAVRTVGEGLLADPTTLVVGTRRGAAGGAARRGRPGQRRRRSAP